MPDITRFFTESDVPVGPARSTGCLLYCSQVDHCRQVCRGSLITLQRTSASRFCNESVSRALLHGAALLSESSLRRRSSGSRHGQSRRAQLLPRTDSSFGPRSLAGVCYVERQRYCVLLDELGQGGRNAPWQMHCDFSVNHTSITVIKAELHP